MGLFKQSTLQDMFMYIDAIKRSDQPQQDRYDKAVHANKNSLLVIQALSLCGGLFSRAADDDKLRSVVLHRVIDPPSLSPAALAARRDLALAFLTTADDTASDALMRQQAKDSTLTTLERFFSLISLLATAGLVARDLNVEFFAS